MFRSLTLVSLSLEFTSPHGWMEAFGSAQTQSSPSRGRVTKFTTSMLETLQMQSHLGTGEFSLFLFSFLLCVCPETVFEKRPL